MFQGLSRVVNHLLTMKERHSHVVVVNVRNDLTVELDGTTYSVRDATNMEEPVIFPGYSRQYLEVTRAKHTFLFWQFY